MRRFIVSAIVLWIGCATTLWVGTSGAGAQPPPPNYAPIPPPRTEVVPRFPGGRVIWQPGHWHWDGVRYIWVGGRYIDRRPHYGHYAEGRWVWASGAGRWIWRPAHWE